MASDSRSPAVPAGGPSPASLGARRGAPRRASGPGSGAESPSSRDTGRGRKGGRPLARHAPHVRGEPGAKPFVDDLLLGRGFVRSRAAPSLRSIESQPSTQGFVAPACRPAGRPAGGAGALWWSVPPSRSSPSAGSASPPGGRRAAALHAVGVVRAGRGEREKTGAPLTAPPGLGVPRPPPLPRRGPSPAGWDGGWGGEAWRGCESGGVAGRPRRPLSQGGRAGPGGWLRAPVAAVTSVCARVPSLWSQRQGEERGGEGR